MKRRNLYKLALFTLLRDSYIYKGMSKSKASSRAYQRVNECIKVLNLGAAQKLYEDAEREFCNEIN